MKPGFPMHWTPVATDPSSSVQVINAFTSSGKGIEISCKGMASAPITSETFTIRPNQTYSFALDFAAVQESAKTKSIGYACANFFVGDPSIVKDTGYPTLLFDSGLSTIGKKDTSLDSFGNPNTAGSEGKDHRLQLGTFIARSTQALVSIPWNCQYASPAGAAYLLIDNVDIHAVPVDE